MAYPTLKDIAEVYRKEAADRAPVKTGKLRDSIRVSYKRLDDLSYSFDLNTKGASYGIWWNVPPPIVKRKKLSRRPGFNFAIKAQKSKPVQNVINQYIKAEIDLMVTEKMQKAFEKGGYSKLRQSFGK